MTAVLTTPLAPARPLSRSGTARRLTRVTAVVVMLDALTLALAAVVAVGLKFGFATWPPADVDRLTGSPLVDFGWLVPVWLAALAFADAWSPRTLARGGEELKALVRGSLTGAGVVAMAAYLVDYDMSRGYFALAWGIGTTGLLLERSAVRQVVGRLRRGHRLVNRIVVVGDPIAVTELDTALARQPELGYRIVGACVDAADPSLPVPLLGRPADAVDACREHRADTLLIANGSFSSSVDLRQLGWDLEDTDIDLIVVPNLIDVAGPRIRLHPVAGLPFVHVDPPQVARALRWGKAVFDRLGASFLLLLLAPVLLAVALAVKLDDGGPVLYRHRRIGLDGREFGLWKFRSMVPDAATQHAALVDARGDTPLLFKLSDDPRVTRVGTVLRRWSVDELPQLLNVLAGQMSLVGPRPQVAAEVACYSPAMHRRLRVRPGMTGLWQVSGRSELTAAEAERLDLSYVENWSMTADLTILARTTRAVLRGEGAF
ncbi:sugar transferase [Nocardioides carbamazepini]|uniref:sugar transferase n=1 Tax=Nocardioides carbamazepini TaxID=2854259 RepID=UPI002149E110|nr:sugar transferase [Nocardioides carbamazepini]MCR1781695.1 sugar transferase [Nocardioides carbamazepini]